MSKDVIKRMAFSIAATEDSPTCTAKGKIAAENDRIVRPKEAVTITGRSLASQYRDKLAGNWVPAYRIGINAVGYLLSDLLALNASRELVTTDNTRPVAPKAKRGRKAKNVEGGQ